jgi:hypothetical protein
MKGPKHNSDTAWKGAVFLSNSKDPTEYFFWKDPIYCTLIFIPEKNSSIELMNSKINLSDI